MFKVMPMFRRLIALVLVVPMLGLTTVPIVHAEIIGTELALQLEAREATLSRVEALLAREEVRNEMLALGADPAEVQERLAALTDAELQVIEANLTTLPAGGDSIFIVIGVVFVVLIILELVGVTNIFTKM
jgi:hypothetical protein